MLGDQRAPHAVRAGPQRQNALLSAITAALGLGNPAIVRAVKVTVLLVVLQAILVVGLWWLSEEWLTPKMPTGIERIADLYAAAAGRLMTATDQRALDILIRQATAWPEASRTLTEPCSPTPIRRASAGCGTRRSLPGFRRRRVPRPARSRLSY